MKISNKQYISAYFDLAKEKECLDQGIKELETVSRCFSSIKSFLDNPNVSKDKKKDDLSKLELNSININFLFLLKQNEDLLKLNLITNGLRKKLNQVNGILESTFITAAPIDEQEEIEIKRRIEDIFKGKINIKKEVDESILGGFIIKIEDRLIDASLKNQLYNLKNSLLTE